MNNRNEYNRVFCETFNVGTDLLNEEFTIKNVEGWDSVVHLSLISKLEDTFDIMFDSEDILHFGSYLNGIIVLKKYGVEID